METPITQRPCAHKPLRALITKGWASLGMALCLVPAAQAGMVAAKLRQHGVALVGRSG